MLFPGLPLLRLWLLIGTLLPRLRRRLLRRLLGMLLLFVLLRPVALALRLPLLARLPLLRGRLGALLLL